MQIIGSFYYYVVWKPFKLFSKSKDLWTHNGWKPSLHIIKQQTRSWKTR